MIAILGARPTHNITLYLDGVFIAKAVGSLTVIKHQHKLQAVQVEDGPLFDVTFLASSSNGVRTDGSWRCTNTYHDGWFLPSYNDTAWPSPYVFPSKPGNNFIAPDAKPIGYLLKPSNIIYCRGNATIGEKTFLTYIYIYIYAPD